MINEKIRQAAKRNDLLIKEIVDSPLFDIREDGSIFSRIAKSGRLSPNWRFIEPKLGVNYKCPRLKYKRISLIISRIVYQKFLGDLDYGKCVFHKDKNKLNNNPTNLELR